MYSNQGIGIEAVMWYDSIQIHVISSIPVK